MGMCNLCVATVENGLTETLKEHLGGQKCMPGGALRGLNVQFSAHTFNSKTIKIPTGFFEKSPNVLI